LKYELDMQDMRIGAMREGLAQGRAEEKRETAIKLKAIGLSIAQIAEVTGLLAEEIEKL